MRVLVTGAGGFVGKHLLRELRQAGHVPLALDLEPCTAPEAEASYIADLRNADSLRAALSKADADACIHLAGIAFVPTGWTDPELVFDVNLNGTVNLLESLRHQGAGLPTLVVTSAEVYGRDPRPGLIHEQSAFHPSNPYAVSKLAADLTALLYARRYAMPVMTARPGNHIGPGQSIQFVTSAFAEQVIRIRRGRAENLIKVGNLDGERDFTDVRDVVRAYRMIIEKGRPAHAYNIATGHPVKIQLMLDILCRLAGIQPNIQVDPERYRPTDNPPILDIAHIRDAVGWEPRIPLETTLQDILDDFDRRAAAATGTRA